MRVPKRRVKYLRVKDPNIREKIHVWINARHECVFLSESPRILFCQYIINCFKLWKDFA